MCISLCDLTFVVFGVIDIASKFLAEKNMMMKRVFVCWEEESAGKILPKNPRLQRERDVTVERIQGVP